MIKSQEKFVKLLNIHKDQGKILQFCKLAFKNVIKINKKLQ